MHQVYQHPFDGDFNGHIGASSPVFNNVHGDSFGYADGVRVLDFCADSY